MTMQQVNTGHGPQDGQYLTFQLGGEMFAIGILAVKEIIEYRGLTEVPMMPRHVRGVINLRGAVVPVLDPAARFGRVPAVPTRRTCVVVVEVAGEDGERQSVGMLVDAVSEVLEIPAGQIEPPPPFGTRIRTEYIAGVGKVRGRFVMLLAVGEVLSLEPESRAARAEEAVPA
jgi:purine-binding chemotaxis protein CheW